MREFTEHVNIVAALVSQRAWCLDSSRPRSVTGAGPPHALPAARPPTAGRPRNGPFVLACRLCPCRTSKAPGRACGSLRWPH